MKGKGLASLIIAMSPKGKAPEAAEKSSDHGAAIDDIWDAIQSNDKAAFRDAVESYSEMCKGMDYNDDDKEAEEGQSSDEE